MEKGLPVGQSEAEPLSGDSAGQPAQSASEQTHRSLYHGHWGDARKEAGLGGGITCPSLNNIPVEGPLSSSALCGGGEADSPVLRLVSGPQLVLSPSNLHSPVHILLAVTSAGLRGLPVRVTTVPGEP